MWTCSSLNFVYVNFKIMNMKSILPNCITWPKFRNIYISNTKMVNGNFNKKFQICYQATPWNHFFPFTFFQITIARIRTDFVFGLTDEFHSIVKNGPPSSQTLHIYLITQQKMHYAHPRNQSFLLLLISFIFGNISLILGKSFLFCW